MIGVSSPLDNIEQQRWQLLTGHASTRKVVTCERVQFIDLSAATPHTDL